MLRFGMLTAAFALLSCADSLSEPVESTPVTTAGNAGMAGVAGVATSGGAGDGGSAGTATMAGSSGSANGGGGASTGSGGLAASAGAAGSGGVIAEVSSEGDGNVTVGPNYPKDPLLTDQGNPRGKRFTFTLRSQDSAIFKGTDPTLTKTPLKQDWQRAVDVYVPAQYVDGDEAPILLMQEGQRTDSVGQLNNVSRALDNLTIATDANKKLPVFIAIAVENGDDRDNADGKGSERGLEYDTLSDRYTRFVDSEVLPAVLANVAIKEAYPKLKLTQNPDGRATMGCSSGAAAAFTMGWFGTFQRVISYSGTLVAQQNEAQPEAQLYPTGAWEYHSEKELIKNASKKPLRIFIHASERDNGAGAEESGHHNWVMANERTAEDLKAKGYHYRYVFSKDTGHCDGKVFDLTLAETLLWVWRGYPIK